MIMDDEPGLPEGAELPPADVYESWAPPAISELTTDWEQLQVGIAMLAIEHRQEQYAQLATELMRLNTSLVEAGANPGDRYWLCQGRFFHDNRQWSMHIANDGYVPLLTCLEQPSYGGAGTVKTVYSFEQIVDCNYPHGLWLGWRERIDYRRIPITIDARKLWWPRNQAIKRVLKAAKPKLAEAF